MGGQIAVNGSSRFVLDMKRFLSGIVVALICVLATSIKTQAAGHEAQWKRVDDAVQKGLPKTAIQELEPIIRETMAEKKYDEATKAIARRIALEGNIQGNKPEEKIVRLEAEIAKAPKEMVPMMEAVLGNWYWHYFQNNRWRFMQRTTTAQAPGKDFTTWDLPRLFTEIDRHFQTALASPDILKRTPVATWNELLQPGTMPDKYRPTLYDFLAHETLKFYMSGEQAGARAEDAFDLSADSPVLGSSNDFLAWKPDTTDTQSPKLKAIMLFQELLRFHQKDQDPSAFIDADLERLQFGYNSAFGENKNARFKTALKAFVDKWADHELSASALHAWARVLQSEEDLVEARNLAQRGAQVFGNSPGGKMCRNLISEIEAKTASVTTERVWNAPLPKIAVHYKNLTEVYFRVVAWDWNDFLEKRHGRPEYLNPQERQQLMSKPAVLEWSEKLPATADYKERVQELPAPAVLKPGFYFIVSSFDKNFSDQQNQVSF
ncbi:MAG: Alpha-2-macroglobulin domain protein, partial [Verrucomicrobiales bacterium]|nr:Alpha-2-macroglobulin domain protein [Verrucomicrobiales bacterium]